MLVRRPHGCVPPGARALTAALVVLAALIALAEAAVPSAAGPAVATAAGPTAQTEAGSAEPSVPVDPSVDAPVEPAGIDIPAPPSVTAEGAVLYDPADARVLHGVEEALARPMASTTKVMTALLALEAGALEDTVTVSASAAATGRIPGAATLGLDEGDRIPMRSLLAGLVVRSGNDAAVAVAEHVAGSEAAFVAAMNRRAAELGLTATRGEDASGLTDDPAHVSSPVDLARLAVLAMGNPDFATWASAPRITLPGLGTLTNRNELLFGYEGATGVKTGFTRLAGMCLVASATRGDRTLYAVVLGSEASFADSAALLDHGFADYRRTIPARPEAAVVTYRWAGAETAAVPAEPLDATLPAQAPATWRAVLDPVLDRPVEAGEPLGTARLEVGGQVVDTVELRAATAVDVPAQRTPGATAGAALQDALRGFARLQPVDRAA